VDRAFRAFLLSRFVSQSLHPIISMEKHEDLVALKELIEGGQVTPVIDKTYSLGEAPDAIRYLKSGLACGKLVISVRQAENCPKRSVAASFAEA
jgi:NADPH:quinone reductase-like Zn-dependent oxidoreductase